MTDVSPSERSSEATDTEWEYGIRHVRVGDVHRQGMTLDEAQEWIDGWVEEGGNRDVFQLIRRPLGDWEDA